MGRLRMYGQLVVAAFCLLLTACCLLVFGQGGTGKMPPPNRMPPMRYPPPRQNPTPRRPELKVSERHVRDITVLDLDGRIGAHEGGPVLRNAVSRLVREGKKKILLNFAKVGSIDPTEAEEMVSTYNSVKKDGGQLKLCSPTSKVRDQLVRGSGPGMTVGVVDLMGATFEKEQEALASFR